MEAWTSRESRSRRPADGACISGWRIGEDVGAHRPRDDGGVGGIPQEVSYCQSLLTESEGVIGQVKCPISDDEDSDDY